MSSRTTVLLLPLLTAAALLACAELARSGYRAGDDDGGVDGEGGTPADGDLCPPAEVLHAHNLRRLNQIRAARRVEQPPPLDPDPCLDQIATRSLDAWIAGGPVHGLFEQACLPRLPSCECDWEQENSGRSHGSSWKRSIDRVLGEMMAEEFHDGGHFRNIIAPRWTRVGIAIACRLEEGGVTIHLANEFAR